ncbi:hypothetical protein [Psychroserpens ponticola]|uniref:Cytochrome c n=1 Tax=Psychroserpens ponticola TaxID=2932268 RepID=A0ABY7S084_9FLAO|nr:hypothetical protein [Psychroserpens ponticola]WCO02703.1 hypothetical protein MUN68_004210 [Psychroserpens ponticola]
MLKHVSYIFLIALVFSCNSSGKSDETEKKVSIVDGTERYDVYQGSEMANLMRGMHAFNLQLKKEVENGKVVTEFPEEFLKIHTAEFTKAKSRNQTFDHYSGKFIEAQKMIFVQDSTIPLSERYNNAINLCLSCHQTECTGPIPKIKKLLIK